MGFEVDYQMFLKKKMPVSKKKKMPVSKKKMQRYIITLTIHRSATA